MAASMATDTMKRDWSDIDQHSVDATMNESDLEGESPLVVFFDYCVTLLAYFGPAVVFAILVGSPAKEVLNVSVSLF